MSRNKSSHHRVKQNITRTQDSIRAQTADSFANLSARVGFGAGSQQDASRYKLDFLSRNPYNLEAAYRSNWLAGKVVDAYAEDMTREGVEIISDDLDPDDIDRIHKEMERLRIWSGLTEGLRWSRLYGGAIVVLLVDGQRLNTPLNIETVGPDSFKGVTVFDRWQVSPSLHDLVTDFGPSLGLPKYYDVSPGAHALVGERIHYSRVIRLEGDRLPWRQRLAENGWGQSVIERLYDRLVAFDSTTEGAAQLVYKAHLRTLKVAKFREIVAAGGPMLEGLIKQVAFMRQYQSNEGITILDGTDEFETHSYTFTGLPDLMLRFGEQLSGASGIPLVRLFGQSPAGLSATGESDMRNYYDNIKQKQEQDLRPGILKLLECISRSARGETLPDSFGFEFVPLWQLSETEKAEILQKISAAIAEQYNAGVITWSAALKELRAAAKKTGVFSNISDEDIKDAENEPPMSGDVATIDPKTGKPVLKTVEPKEAA